MLVLNILKSFTWAITKWR